VLPFSALYDRAVESLLEVLVADVWLDTGAGRTHVLTATDILHAAHTAGQKYVSTETVVTVAEGHERPDDGPATSGARPTDGRPRLANGDQRERLGLRERGTK
jgi:hypothetical protein